MTPLTSSEKQSRRIAELDAIAQAAGWATWTKYATAVKRGVVSIATKPKGETKMTRNLYRAWAQNKQGASDDVANRENFTSVKAAESAARREFGAGWKIKINKLSTDENGYILGEEQVKEFTIR